MHKVRGTRESVEHEARKEPQYIKGKPDVTVEPLGPKAWSTRAQEVQDTGSVGARTYKFFINWNIQIYSKAFS